jgi:hypothetical protein
MHLTSSFDFSLILTALPLFPLFLLFWYFQRLSRTSVGFAWGRWRHYVLAIFYPLVVIGAVAGLALAAGDVNLATVHWEKAWLNSARVALATFIVAVITEEGFFRGWLWGSLQKAGPASVRVLPWTSFAFALWHLSAVALDTGFNPPFAQIPVFMVNAAIMGLVWGILRGISGSIIVSSVSHGLWNGVLDIRAHFSMQRIRANRPFLPGDKLSEISVRKS